MNYPLQSQVNFTLQISDSLRSYHHISLARGRIFYQHVLLNDSQQHLSAAFSTTVLSTPAPSASGDISTFFDKINVISRRENPPLPSIKDIQDHLNVPKDVSLFYSGPGGYAKKARDWAKRSNSGYKILAQLWTDSKYQDK